MQGKEAYVLLNKNDYEILNWREVPSYVKDNIDEENYYFFALDLNEKKRLGEYEKYFDSAKFTINIDHHENNKNEADFTISNTQASSTCELIYKIIYSNKKDYINLSISEYLYSGMLNDTNSFSRRLSKETLSIAQELINNGINYTYIIQKTIKERSMYEFKALAYAINEIEYDDFHYLVIDKSNPIYSKLTHNQIVKKLAEDLRVIDGIDIFIILIKNKDTIVSKCMANTSNNADKIASLFGGGGHKKEAGFTIQNTNVEEIISKIKKYINSHSKTRG
jgi:phosphoesterase RecJ-like protein